MENFTAFGLPQELLSTLAQNNFNVPTPIQKAAIPLALEGKDILGTAETGSGKTGAFGIPLISYLLNNPQSSALVMTPTRELAAQVMDMIKKMLGPNASVYMSLLIGGEPIIKQFQHLKKRQPRLIIGTPGRITDHLERRSIKLNTTRFLVLDETDRMLDMGFGIQIDKILTYLPKDKQTLLFSATLPPRIANLSKKYLVNPIRVAVDSTTSPVVRIKQEIIQITEADKYDQLLTQLEQREGSIIVFVKTKLGAEKMAKKLRLLQHNVEAIHGDLKQGQRDNRIQAFRNGKNRIMVATDIAARGLDIPHIRHVINYDLPHCSEDYIHRLGRTARAGAEGSALTLVTPQDSKKWYAIQHLLDPTKKRERIAMKLKYPRKSTNKKYGKASKISRPAA